jgi:hypothetical protein
MQASAKKQLIKPCCTITCRALRAEAYTAPLQQMHTHTHTHETISYVCRGQKPKQTCSIKLHHAVELASLFMQQHHMYADIVQTPQVQQEYENH